MEYFIRKSGDELYHYGIKGQKWGVRRYQDTNGRLTAKGKERYGTHKVGMSVAAGMIPTWDMDPNNITVGRKFGADQLLEVYATRNEKGRYRVDSPVSDENMKERFRQEYLDDPDTAFEKHMSKTNQTNGDESGTTGNCTKVAASMIMARMGYDYDAGRCNFGYGEAFEHWFDGAEKTMSDNLTSAINDKFSKATNGSFGTVAFDGKNGGGHVFNWQKNSKGEFSLYEGQCKNGEKFTGSDPAECFSKYMTRNPFYKTDATVQIYDMTKAKPNIKHIQEDSVLRITDDPNSTSMLLDRKTTKLYTGFSDPALERG